MRNFLALPLLLFLMVISMVSRGQTVTLDQADLDYAPGETVYITGTDFLPGEFVTMTISHIEPGLPLIYHEHALIYATADSTGTFNASWYVEEVELNTTLSLLAEGDQGSLASIVFTDALRTDTYPSYFISFTGGATYCKDDSNASILRAVWRNTSCTGTANGGNTNIPITITWYKNSTNSTTGGTLLIPLYATAATTASSYTPSTTTAGTLYYYVVVSWSAGSNCATAGSITSGTQSVTVNAADTPTITAGGSTSFCPGGSVTLTSSVGSSYLWSTGATTQSISVSSGGNYTVQVTNNNGCISEPSAPITVTINPLPSTPTITAEGSTTLCTGGSVTLTSSVGSSYLWSTGETTRSINVSTSGNYTVRVTNANGCQSDLSAITTVTVRPAPSAAIEITGNSTICSGFTTTIKISGPPNGIVIYNINGGSDITGSINNGGNLNLTTANLTANTTYNLVSVAYGDAPGCSNSVNGSVTITVNQPPVITTQPENQTVTYGGSASFMVASTGIPAPTYQWQINTGLGFTNITGATASTLDVQDPTVAMNGYKYRVIVNNICSTITSNEVSLTVNARPITISADAQSKTYGDADPSLTYHITSGSLAFTDAFSGGLTRVVGEDVGAYAINQGTVALNSNYTLTYIGANLTIGKRPVTITADAQSKTYGDADPALTYEITTGTLAFNDTFTGALTRDTGEDVGSHAITQGTVDLGNNYMLTYIGADLSITTRPVAITADIQSKVYGEADPALTYKITSGTLAFNDTFTGVLARDAGEDVGSYIIKQGTVALSDNYTLSYITANLSITKRPVTITADAKTKVYGEADPALTYNITSGNLAFSDDFIGALYREAGESVGDYAITQGTVTLNTNYDLSYVGDKLIITKRPVSITADAKTKVYGNEDPALTYQITLGSLAFTDAFTGSLTRNAGENVGSYVINQGSVALSDNYTLSYITANLSITSRPVTITADAKTKVYGEADPALTYEITSGNLAFLDAFTGSLTRNAGEIVGAYDITQGTVALNSNYDLKYVGNKLTITIRPITITADAKSKVYGNDDPDLTYQITSGSLAFLDAFIGSLTRNAGENVGTYAITQGTIALNSNYLLSYVPANLSITKRPVTVTADANQMKYIGQVDPTFEYSITSGSLAFSEAFSGILSRVTGECPGTYAIGQGTLSLSSNYTLSYIGADFTINGVTIDASQSSYPVPSGTAATLTAKVVPAVAGVKVYFTLDNGTSAIFPCYEAITGNTGTAQCTLPVMAVEVYKVTANVGVINSSTYCTSSTAAYLAIYDPTGGFVTGGGWINSPAGAYPTNPALTGKANFGFNSKYEKGKTTPTGNTEFQFQAGNLNFSSSTYGLGSLVIAGAKATYKGVGTINGSGSYAFMVSTIDGDVTGGSGIDKFRIKIWDANNKVIYDNNMGVDENDLPTTALGGGSIVIHSADNKNKIAQIYPDTSANAFVPTLKVYPNPFTDRLNIEFSYATDTKGKLEIYSITGAKLQTLYDGPVTGGQLYNFEYLPRLVSSQVVFYHLTLDGKMQVGKILYSERR